MPLLRKSTLVKASDLLDGFVQAHCDECDSPISVERYDAGRVEIECECLGYIVPDGHWTRVVVMA